jgi:hypothetical protein
MSTTPTPGLPPEIGAALTAYHDTVRGFVDRFVVNGERAQIDAIRHLAAEVAALKAAREKAPDAPAPKRTAYAELVHLCDARGLCVVVHGDGRAIDVRDNSGNLFASACDPEGVERCANTLLDLLDEEPAAPDELARLRAEVDKLKAELATARERHHAEAREGIAKALEKWRDGKLSEKAARKAEQDDSGFWHAGGAAVAFGVAANLARNWKEVPSERDRIS